MTAIGKTRQEEAVIEQVFDSAAGPARGILNAAPSAGHFRHARVSPPPELAHCIAHYWLVSWDLRGLAPHTPATLPHPNVHAIFEPGGSTVAGVHTAKFTRRLEGRSHVFGVKFTPGGFRPFLDAPVSSLTDSIVPIRSIFSSEIDALEAILIASGDEHTLVPAANNFFLARVPAPDENATLAAHLVNRILAEPAIRAVEDLSRAAGLGKRSLQRLFSEYVGAPPKWVIRRYRLHELVERFNSGERPDYAQLALELGYFDQAHLINDFRSIAGYSPAQYHGRAPSHISDKTL
jgi:AraC-like DNA-binding protein